MTPASFVDIPLRVFGKIRPSGPVDDHTAPAALKLVPAPDFKRFRFIRALNVVAVFPQFSRGFLKPGDMVETALDGMQELMGQSLANKLCMSHEAGRNVYGIKPVGFPPAVAAASGETP